MTNRLKLIVLSVSCCSPDPRMPVYDQQYLSRIKEALSRTKVEADVELLPATNAFFSLKAGYLRKLLPLFNKFGPAVAPALFVDGELALYGGVPTVDRLVETIEKSASGTQTHTEPFPISGERS